MAKFTKQQTRSILHDAAVSYQEKLSWRMFRLIYENRVLHLMEVADVIFLPEHFKHLTGIKTKMSAGWFYDACRKKRLSDRDIIFDRQGNTQRKLEVIRAMPEVFYHPCWIGASLNNDIYINADYYVGDTRCVLSVGFRGTVDGDVPITLKKQSIREVVTKEYKVFAIAAKSLRDEKAAWELTYCEKGFSPEKWI